MQTFLPLANFHKSAAVLDNKRLGKQRVECKQILLCLGFPVGDHTPNRSGRRNHPAVQMWAGYEFQLAAYSAVICREWRARGFRDSLLPQFLTLWRARPVPVVDYPDWFGCPALHASHRSNLLRKDAAHYSRFGWHEADDLPYFWPTHATV